MVLCYSAASNVNYKDNAVTSSTARVPTACGLGTPTTGTGVILGNVAGVNSSAEVTMAVVLANTTKFNNDSTSVYLSHAGTNTAIRQDSYSSGNNMLFSVYRAPDYSGQENLTLSNTFNGVTSVLLADYKRNSHQRIFLNGNLGASRTPGDFDASFNATGSSQSYISYGQQRSAHVLLACTWLRILTGEEIKSFSDNPWQIFKPRKRVIYFDVSSFPVLYSLTASYITSSGGRLTVN
jgi:hypothetical protein